MRKSDSGRGFIGEPRRTACTELRGNDTVVPDEAWAVHGEDPETDVTDVGIFDCDSDRDPRDSENHHVETKNLSEEDFYPDRHDRTEDEREANRDPEWNPNKIAEAGVNLMIELGLSPTPTRQMCDVIGVYIQRLECRMDGVIHYCLDNRRDEEVVKASLEFAEKMNKYFPEISKEARDRLVADAQTEQQLQRRIDGPANKLGKVLFGNCWNRWSRLLRATV